MLAKKSLDLKLAQWDFILEMEKDVQTTSTEECLSVSCIDPGMLRILRDLPCHLCTSVCSYQENQIAGSFQCQDSLAKPEL